MWILPESSGFPHSEIPGSKPVCRLPEAYRRLRRPSSPLAAKASTECTFMLDHIIQRTSRPNSPSSISNQLRAANAAHSWGHMATVGLRQRILPARHHLPQPLKLQTIGRRTAPRRILAPPATRASGYPRCCRIEQQCGCMSLNC